MTAIKNETGLWEVEVDGRKYEFQKWGAEESLTTLLRMAKAVGPPLGNLVSSILGSGKPGEKLDVDRDIPNLQEVVASSLADGIGGLDAKEVVALCKAFSSGNRVLCDGVQVNFDKNFEQTEAEGSGLAHMFRVVYAGIGVQYGSFFNALQGIAGIARRRTPKGVTGTPAQ